MGINVSVRGAAGSSALGRAAARVAALVGLQLCMVEPTSGRASTPSVEQLRNLSIEDLVNIRVTSVFKRPDPRSTLSLTLYYHDYDDLRVQKVSPATGLLEFGNEQTGFTYGLESWGDYRVTQWWRLMAGVNLIRKHLQLGPTASTVALYQHQGDDPGYQLFLRSYLNLTDDLEFDATVRRIDTLPSPAVPSYTALGLHLGWQVTERDQLSLVGLNLLDSQHPETGTPAERGEIPRSVYVSTRVKF